MWRDVPALQASVAFCSTVDYRESTTITSTLFVLQPDIPDIAPLDWLESSSGFDCYLPVFLTFNIAWLPVVLHHSTSLLAGDSDGKIQK